MNLGRNELTLSAIGLVAVHKAKMKNLDQKRVGV